MPRRKSEFHQLAGAPFYIFRGRAVLKDDQRVGAFESGGDDFQPKFELVLLAIHNEKPWVFDAETTITPVVCELRTDQHDVVKFAVELAAQLVHHEPRFARVCRPHDQHVERYAVDKVLHDKALLFSTGNVSIANFPVPSARQKEQRHGSSCHLCLPNLFQFPAGPRPARRPTVFRFRASFGPPWSADQQANRICLL